MEIDMKMSPQSIRPGDLVQLNTSGGVGVATTYCLVAYVQKKYTLLMPKICHSFSGMYDTMEELIANNNISLVAKREDLILKRKDQQ